MESDGKLGVFPDKANRRGVSLPTVDLEAVFQAAPEVLLNRSLRNSHHSGVYLSSSKKRVRLRYRIFSSLSLIWRL
jgi:hypothetical protein